MKTDRWGESIPAPRRSFPLAALFRGMTLIALCLGIVSLSDADPRLASGVLVALAAVLSGIVFHRQPGARGTKLAVACLFGLGFMLVASHVWGVSRLFARRPSDVAQVDFTGLLGGCWAVFAVPIVLAVFVLLLRCWVRLANLAGERPLAKEGRSARLS